MHNITMFLFYSESILLLLSSLSSSSSRGLSGMEYLCVLKFIHTYVAGVLLYLKIAYGSFGFRLQPIVGLVGTQIVLHCMFFKEATPCMFQYSPTHSEHNPQCLFSYLPFFFPGLNPFSLSLQSNLKHRRLEHSLTTLPHSRGGNFSLNIQFQAP